MDMKKLFCISSLIAIVIFLSSCSKKWDATNLEFPKTTWGMNIEAVFDCYGITKEDTSLYDVNGRGSVFVIEGYELFGEKSSQIVFQFLEFADNGDAVLSGVRVTYPEGADMNHVLEKMEEAYGKTDSDIITYEVNWGSGDELTEQIYRESDQLKFWAGESVGEVIPENESEDYRERWEFYQRNLTEENWGVFIENSSLVTVFWLDNEDERSLRFNAYNLGVYNELKSQLSGQ